MGNNFYCQKKCGGNDYLQGFIDEAVADCKGMNFTDKETKTVLDDIRNNEARRLCTVQCTTCRNIVIETRKKNNQLIS